MPALLAMLLAAAPPAAAPPLDRRDQPIEELAADLAHGFCPRFLAGRLPLTTAELAERGFDPHVASRPHPRFGELTIVGSRRKDGDVTFGGASGKVCLVAVEGPNRAATAARLRTSMALTDLAFKRIPDFVPPPAGMTLETWQAPMGPQKLNLQLIETVGAKTGVVAQLFVTT